MDAINNKNYIEHQLIKKNMVFRRSYQEKIFVSSLGKNTMVVLPTSMGKTIVALLLSVYHLSNDIDNKIIFLAPTKPLVVQHQRSFINMTVLGEKEWQLPVLTGNINPEKRKKLMLDAKIAFMTPQVLQNDIISNKIDLSEIVLIIFDEAHRAVGDYAYTFIAEVYVQKNPKGQILGMSASPGGNQEKIEEVCKNLKIENIEIRSSESPDVKPYIQEIKTTWLQFKMPDEYKNPKKDLEELLKSFYKKLYNEDLLDSYALNKNSRKKILACSKRIDSEIRKHRNDDQIAKFFALKKVVSNAIRISHMLELLEAQGIEPLNDFFNKNIAEVRDPKSSKSLKELYTMDPIRKAMKSIKKLVESGFIHPKLEELGIILLDQFKKNPESRVLIFANFRDTINSIIRYLEKFSEIRSERFVGQATKKSGGKSIKGMSQKEQIARLEDFKSGRFNTLIATSVAEEGLDIAECDLVIFYDVVPSEIRTIQRRGRTGRKDAGEIIILMTKGTREEGYYWASRNREKEMKKSLLKMKNVSLKYTQNNSNNENIKEPEKNKKKLNSKAGNLLDYMQSSENNHHLDNINEKISQDADERFISAEELGGKSKGFSIIADNRESQSAVIRYLALYGIDLVLRNLPAADYVLSEEIGIERKEAVDFNKSIIDGRMFDELFRLNQNFSIPILIIEGNPVGVTGISREAILGAIASIMLKMKISILYTSSAKETAELIFALTKKIQEKKDIRGKIFKKKTNTVAQSQEQVIGGIPGINLFRAQELLSKFSNIKNIFNADEEELKKIQGIGKTTANKIKEIAESDYNKNKE
ncbi:MAG: DEAD/DEAH box helicase [archaeon]|nr:DEAD/DEAH box helicase [archaeon]